MHRLLRSVLLLWAGLWLAACTPPAGSPPHVETAPPKRCHYDVKLTQPQTGQLEVAARCEGGQVRSFVASEAMMAKHVSAQHVQGGELQRRDNHFLLPEGADATIRYQLSLDDVAYDAADIDVVYKTGPGWVTSASAWLLMPDPVGRDTIATVRIDTSAGGGFASGMHRNEQGHYTMRARRIPFATFGVFGAFTTREITVPGPMSLDAKAPAERKHAQAKLQMVVMPGELSVELDVLASWLSDAAHAVGTFWGGFPLERVTVVLIPTPGYAKVVHGKVISAGGPTVALQVGGRLDASRLREDWILVHELFHLGFPTFPHNGKWLDEGLATYYEPIIRTRAGWRSETDLWQEFAYDMPQGLDAMQQKGLERSRDFKDIYWGGALFAFTADLQIRRRSDNKLALEDGLREVLMQGGHAGSIWTVDKAAGIIDQRLGMPVVAELLARHRRSGAPIAFNDTLAQLGVSKADRSVLLDNDAPLAKLRLGMLGKEMSTAPHASPSPEGETAAPAKPADADAPAPASAR